LDDGARIAGPAFTYERRPYVPVDPPDEERVWDTFRATPAEHVAVFATHAAERAVIGDLAIAFLKVRGCAGVVVDGGVRDIDALRKIDLPTFCSFTTPQDVSHGNGGDFNLGHEISIGEVKIGVGDYIVADADGVVVVPQGEIDRVLEKAEALVEVELRAQEAILSGMAPENAFDDSSFN